MAIDNARKRRQAANVPMGIGVIPSAAKGPAWRAGAAGGYFFGDEGGGTADVSVPYEPTATDFFLTDLISRRDNSRLGHDSLILAVERRGGRLVEISAFEPDARTFRNKYYYNSVENALFQRIVISEAHHQTSAIWKRIGPW